MTKFYTAADTEISRKDGISIVKELIETLKQMRQNSLLIIAFTKDFFQQDLALNSVVKLKVLPSYLRFPAMMAYCLPTSSRCSSKPVCSILRRYGHVDQSLCSPLCLRTPISIHSSGNRSAQRMFAVRYQPLTIKTLKVGRNLITRYKRHENQK